MKDQQQIDDKIATMGIDHQSFSQLGKSIGLDEDALDSHSFNQFSKSPSPDDPEQKRKLEDAKRMELQAKEALAE